MGKGTGKFGKVLRQNSNKEVWQNMTTHKRVKHTAGDMESRSDEEVTDYLTPKNREQKRFMERMLKQNKKGNDKVSAEVFEAEQSIGKDSKDTGKNQADGKKKKLENRTIECLEKGLEGYKNGD